MTPHYFGSEMFFMAKNSNLSAAKKAKNDDFYTQLTDIEKELVHYKEQLRGKIINNMNSITYKEIFPLLKENRMWIWVYKSEAIRPAGWDFEVFREHPLVYQHRHQETP